jgi:hypothetical protein
MNHDGWKGVLTLRDSKKDCAVPAWCSMAIRYTDSKGNRHRARIERVDDKFQHMAFYIDFDGNEQKFGMVQ